MIGVSRSTLYEIEQGHPPNLETLDCIARHLDLPAAFLISDSFSLPQTDQALLFLQSLDWYQHRSQPDRHKFLQLLMPLLIFLSQYPSDSE